MLLLRFEVDGQPYAIDCRRVAEVVPRVALRPVPHAPPYLPGLLPYRGRVVPVLDLGRLLGGAACAERLSTRVIVAEAGRLVGLLAERVCDLVRVAGPTAAPPVATAAYLGPVLDCGGELVQLLHLDQLAAPAVLPPMQEPE